jgi:hypothetical protein
VALEGCCVAEEASDSCSVSERSFLSYQQSDKETKGTVRGGDDLRDKESIGFRV